MLCRKSGKTALLAQLLPEARIEAWELSLRQGKGSRKGDEASRLFGEDTPFHGDALVLEPEEPPGMVLLDAPCTGSGTWGRHPEGKWRLSERHVSLCAELQKELLSKAVRMVAPGGYVVYVTCSLFREENEQVVADALSRFRNVVDIPFAGGKPFQKGRPWGAALWPLLPWIDGFYVCVLKKRE
jgi:16S rRNA (cytosine967-C5)-methyltransferase